MTMSRQEWMDEKLDQIRDILKELHRGARFEDLKERFREVLRGVSPWEIPLVEQELVAQGVSPLEIASLCDLHVALFRESLMDTKLEGIEPGHPVDTFLRENEEILKDSEKLMLYASSLAKVQGDERERVFSRLRELASQLRGLRRHFVRLQFLLFPYIERRGLTAVPRVLWTKQDQVMAKVGKLNRLLADPRLEDASYLEEVRKLSDELSRALVDMIFRENRILYPTVTILLTPGEWSAIRLEEPAVGYYRVEPREGWRPVEPVYPHQIAEGISEEQIAQMPQEMRAMTSLMESRDEHVLVRAGDLELRNGYLTPRELDALLRTLPFEITFVDADDRLRYYSARDDLIFYRSRTVLGRKVELCHPPGSVHIVKRIVEEFRAGKRDVAEFWIDMGGRKIHIRYFPVRDDHGNYLGTVEVVQDITEIQELEGEKRLLDEDQPGAGS